jgi:hypothetical protein
MATPTLRTARVLVENGDRGVVVDPWPQFDIEVLKEDDILRIVLSHEFPACLVAPHAPGPEFVSRVANLLAEADELGDVIEFVGDEAELGFTRLVKVKMLGWGRWTESVFEPLPIQNGYIKLFSVIVYDDVGLFAKAMNRLQHTGLGTALDTLEVDSILAQPFGSPAKH